MRRIEGLPGGDVSDDVAIVHIGGANRETEGDLLDDLGVLMSVLEPVEIQARIVSLQLGSTMNSLIRIEER